MINVSLSTLHTFLKTNHKLRGYKLKILHALNPNENLKRFKFSVELLNANEMDKIFNNHIIFSDEEIFHISGYVNCHNVRIFGE